jgi:hypothetical protein
MEYIQCLEANPKDMSSFLGSHDNQTLNALGSHVETCSLALWSWVSLILNRWVDKKEFPSYQPFSFEFYDKAKVMTIHKKI